MKPTFFFQKIYSRDGKVVGVEFLTREFGVNNYTDIYLFYCALEEVSKINLPVPVHLNIFPSSVPHINWEEISKEFRNTIVVEVIEEGVGRHIEDLEGLVNSGIRYALDDFGNGSSNFSILKRINFPIVKVDAEFSPPGVIRELKESLGVEFVIAEKSNFSPFADAFQSFELHYPEPIENLEESLALEEKAKGFLRR